MSILETILLCVMILWVAYDQRMMNRKIRKLEEFADQHLLRSDATMVQSQVYLARPLPPFPENPSYRLIYNLLKEAGDWLSMDDIQEIMKKDLVKYKVWAKNTDDLRWLHFDASRIRYFVKKLIEAGYVEERKGTRPYKMKEYKVIL